MKKSRLGLKIFIITMVLLMTTAAVYAGTSYKRGHFFGRPFTERMKPERLTEEQKAKMLEKVKTDLSEKLEKGEITEEEYNSMLEKIENGKMPFGGRGKGMPRVERPEKMTEEQKAKMLEKIKADLSEKLEKGKITEEEYNSMLEKIENGKMPFGGRVKGIPRGKGRKGMPMGDRHQKENE